MDDHGIDVELIDARTLRPLDTATMINSIKKTNRCITVEEAWPVNSVGSYIASEIMLRAFDYLDAPPARLAYPDVPVPYSRPLEQFCLPNADTIAAAASALVGR